MIVRALLVRVDGGLGRGRRRGLGAAGAAALGAFGAAVGVGTAVGVGVGAGGGALTGTVRVADAPGASAMPANSVAQSSSETPVGPEHIAVIP